MHPHLYTISLQPGQFRTIVADEFNVSIFNSFFNESINLFSAEIQVPQLA